jgi:hypothetical protein
MKPLAHITATAVSGERRRNSHIFVRDPNDWYLEPHWCSERLFAVEEFNRAATLLDPCTGTGRIANAAKGAGYRVITADIVDRGYPGCRIQDFLKRRSAPPSVVGNPPFAIVEEFARHAFDLGADKVALIARTASIHAARWLHELPFSHAWLMTPRPSMPPGQHVLDGGKVEGDRTDYCWLVLKRGYVGEPVIRWLHKNPQPPTATVREDA